VRSKIAASVLVLSAVTGLAPEARAQGRAGGSAGAEALLVQLEAIPEDRALAKDLIARSRRALERSRKARAASDHRHGAELEALALELAETGRDLVRAAKAERALSEIEGKTRELEARAVRARALVEQTVARRGRASEQLQRVQAERAASPAPNGKAKPAPKPKAGGSP
jgi:colicin import membrane protein